MAKNKKYRRNALELCLLHKDGATQSQIIEYMCKDRMQTTRCPAPGAVCTINPSICGHVINIKNLIDTINKAIEED